MVRRVVDLCTHVLLTVGLGFFLCLFFATVYTHYTYTRTRDGSVRPLRDSLWLVIDNPTDHVWYWRHSFHIRHYTSWYVFF